MNDNAAILTANGRKGPLTGANWDRYHIGDLLGQGGMASVYLAHVKETGERVALKVMLGHSTQDHDARRRFEREAESASRIDSPYVVRVHHASSFQGLLYIELEYVRGENISEILHHARESGRPLGQAQILRYAQDVALGLQAAALEGIIHRDIKPSNLLLSEKGIVKVSDFGVVKVFGEETMTMTGVAIGTPLYMSPEQARSEDIDTRADIYSLGVVLYEACCGEVPFTGTSPDVILYKHHYEEPILPTKRSDNCSLDFEAVIIKCLQKNVDNRYQSWDEVLEDFQAIGQSRAPSYAVFRKRGRRTGAAEMLRQAGIQQRRILFACIILMTFALCCGATYWWYDQRQRTLEGLRSELVILDQVASPGSQIEEKLQQFTAYMGSDDRDQKRWSRRYRAITVARKVITDMQGTADIAGQRQQMPAALDRLQLLVGARDPFIADCRQQLQEWSQQETSLQQLLATIKERPIDQDHLEKTPERIRRLSALVFADNIQLLAWRSLYSSIQETVSKSRIDIRQFKVSAVATRNELIILRRSVENLAVVFGEHNSDVVSGREQIAEVVGRLGALRRNLVLLNSEPIPGKKIRATLRKNLLFYSALVSEDDPQVAIWRGRLADATAEEKRLGDLLRTYMDKGHTIHVREYSALRSHLHRYAELIGEETNESAQLQATLDTLELRYQGERAQLEIILAQRQLEYSDGEQLRTLVVRLRAIGGLSEQEDHEAQRLQHHMAAQRTVLAGQLKTLDRVQSFPLLVMNNAFAQYRKIVSSDNSDVEKWQHTLSVVTELHQQLSILDRTQRPDTNVSQALDDLKSIVGVEDKHFIRWQILWSRQQALYEKLIPLDQQRTEAAQSRENLDAWFGIVGKNDLDGLRWQEKLAAIGLARTAVQELLSRTQIGPEADAQVEILQALVGADDALVVAALQHREQLIPSQRPPWADLYAQDGLGYYADYTVADVQFKMRYIPAGRVTLGSPLDEAFRDEDEQEAEVHISKGFWMLAHEVTQEQWQALMGSHDWFHHGKEFPADHISWNDAQKFCRQMNEHASLACRLPSEAQWALADSVGKIPGQEAGALERRAWFIANARGQSHAVAQLQISAIGLYDMSGNVWEWCEDSYGAQAAEAAIDPRVRSSQSAKIIRGGSWGDSVEKLRPANRGQLDADIRSAYVGMRFIIPLSE